MRISDWSSDVCSSDLIFFGVANDLMDTLRRIGSAHKIIIQRMRRVPLLDASGVTALGDIVDHAEVLGIRVILSGVTAQPMEMLERVSLGPSSSRVLHSAYFADAVRLADRKRQRLHYRPYST